MKHALRARKFSVEKEGLKRPERLNCYNWQFIYIWIKLPLLRLDWLEGKTKTKMIFEFEVINIRNAMPLTTCTHFFFTDIANSKYWINKNNWPVPNISFNCSVSCFYLKKCGCGFREILLDIVGWIMWALICWHFTVVGCPKVLLSQRLWCACLYICCHNYTSWLKNKPG